MNPLNTLKHLVHRLVNRPKIARDPLNRRIGDGQLNGLGGDYFTEQARALDVLVPAALESGRQGTPWNDLAPLLLTPAMARIGERAVEYPWTIHALASQGAQPGTHHLDVGCVMNNASVADALLECFDMVWFMNPSPERLAYSERAGYILGDPRSHRLPTGLRFHSISCLSTLEHVWLDTRRYGGPGGEVNVDPKHPEKNAIPLVGALVELLQPGGRLLVSVPFGVMAQTLPGEPR